MQNSGITKTGPSSEKTDSEAIQGIKKDLEGMQKDLKGIQRKNAISKYANKQSSAKLQEEVDECKKRIDKLFRHSEIAQPSKRVNIGASIADSTALLLSASTGNPLSLIVIPFSEIIALLKNQYDKNRASKLRKDDLSRLESMKQDIISRLKTNKHESRELVDETNKLFSDIEHKSKEDLATALRSRLEGFAGSASALLLGLAVSKPASDIIDTLVLAQPIQPQPYPAALISYATKLIVGGISYVVGSSIASYMLDAAYNKRRSSTSKRESEKNQLQERAEKLLKKIAETEH